MGSNKKAHASIAHSLWDEIRKEKAQLELKLTRAKDKHTRLLHRC